MTVTTGAIQQEIQRGQDTRKIRSQSTPREEILNSVAFTRLTVLTIQTVM